MPPPAPTPQFLSTDKPTEFGAAYISGVLHGQNAAEVRVIKGPDGSDDGIPFVLIGNTALSLRDFMPPRLGAMTPSFDDPDSLIVYANRFKLPETSLIFAEFRTDGGTFTIVFDYPALGAVSRKEHVASYRVTPTVAWTDWLRINDKFLDQDDFCAFIEKYRQLFQQPSGLEMLDLARYMEGKKSGNFTFGKRLQTGDRQVEWKEETTLTGGAELTPIPEQVEISIEMFEGTGAVPMRAWFRVYPRSGTIAFKLEIQEVDRTVRSALELARTRIATETGLPVLLGRPKS
jgi:hypothetical protein